MCLAGIRARQSGNLKLHSCEGEIAKIATRATINTLFRRAERRNRCGNTMLKGKLLTRHPPIELAVAENMLFALPPINRIVPTTKTKMTASVTAYSAIPWP
jgi:hypothetical protein